MKIALICTEKLPVPPVAGGAIQLYIEGILPALSGKHEITVFGVKHESLPDDETVNGVRFIRVNASKDDKNLYIRNIIPYLDDSFGLVHVFNRPKWVLSIGSALPDIRISLSLHNAMFHSDKISPAQAVSCIKRVEFIVTVSKFIANGVKKLYPSAAGKLHTVYSGVSVESYKPAFSDVGAENKIRLKKKLGIENKKAIIFVGRLGEKKGVNKLIEAMKIVMSTHDDAALVIVGSKWYGANTNDDFTRSVLDSAETLQGPVIFTGFIPPSQIPDYYNAGDIFVCPSQWEEPLARVHYEAMAAGLPIITTNRGGNAEVVRGFDNGLIVDDYSNPASIAVKINELLDNPELAESMGRKGRELAERMYDWKRVADDILTLIENSVTIETVISPDSDDIAATVPAAGNSEGDIADESEIDDQDSSDQDELPTTSIEAPVENDISVAEASNGTTQKSNDKWIENVSEEFLDISESTTETVSQPSGWTENLSSSGKEETDEPAETQTKQVKNSKKRVWRDPSMPPLAAYYLDKCKHYLD